MVRWARANAARHPLYDDVTFVNADHASLAQTEIQIDVKDRAGAYLLQCGRKNVQRDQNKHPFATADLAEREECPSAPTDLAGKSKGVEGS